MKHLRRKRNNILSVLEELADVEIMLGQMRCIFDSEMIDEVKAHKLARLAERVEEAEDDE